MPGDDYLEALFFERRFDVLLQPGLVVSVYLADVAYAEALQHLPDRYLLRYVVEVAAHGRMVLVTGHRRGSVFHDYKGEVVFVENGVHYSGQACVEEGGIAQEGDHPPGIVEHRKTGRRTGGMAHAK